MSYFYILPNIRFDTRYSGNFSVSWPILCGVNVYVCVCWSNLNCIQIAFRQILLVWFTLKIVYCLFIAHFDQSAFFFVRDQISNARILRNFYWTFSIENNTLIGVWQVATKKKKELITKSIVTRNRESKTLLNFTKYFINELPFVSQLKFCLFGLWSEVYVFEH